MEKSLPATKRESSIGLEAIFFAQKNQNSKIKRETYHHARIEVYWIKIGFIEKNFAKNVTLVIDYEQSPFLFQLRAKGLFPQRLYRIVVPAESVFISI